MDALEYISHAKPEQLRILAALAVNFVDAELARSVGIQAYKIHTDDHALDVDTDERREAWGIHVGTALSARIVDARAELFKAVAELRHAGRAPSTDPSSSRRLDMTGVP